MESFYYVGLDVYKKTVSYAVNVFSILPASRAVMRL